MRTVTAREGTCGGGDPRAAAGQSQERSEDRRRRSVRRYARAGVRRRPVRPVRSLACLSPAPPPASAPAAGGAQPARAPGDLSLTLPKEPVEALTAREAEVLRHMAAGLSNAEIAGRLFISLGTVKQHAHHINGKLGTHSRTGAIAAAGALGLLVPAQSKCRCGGYRHAR